MENIFTAEMIEKAKAAQSAEEILTLAKESGVDMTGEDANAYYEQLHKTGALSDDELGSVAGGGCQTSANDKNYTVVTSRCRCFNGGYLNNFTENGKIIHSFNESGLREYWHENSGNRQCGSCAYLDFKGAIGYCGRTGK